VAVSHDGKSRVKEKRETEIGPKGERRIRAHEEVGRSKCENPSEVRKESRQPQITSPSNLRRLRSPNDRWRK